MVRRWHCQKKRRNGGGERVYYRSLEGQSGRYFSHPVDAGARCAFGFCDVRLPPIAAASQAQTASGKDAKKRACFRTKKQPGGMRLLTTRSSRLSWWPKDSAPRAGE
jgi:hypothetical protein